MITGTKIEATIDSETETQNNYKVKFKLGLTGKNETQTEVKWYLLKSGSGQALANVNEAPDCELKTEATSGTTKYWYATKSSDGPGTCSAKNYVDAKLSDAKLVAWGKMSAAHNGALTEESGAATDLEEALTSNTPSGLENETLYTTKGDQQFTEEYYYLIIEYPNNTGLAQNDDKNKNISISINAINDVTSELVPAA